MRTGSFQLAGPTAALVMGLLLSASVRAGDLLDDAKAKQAVEAQRVERLVNEARNNAARLAKTSPSDAVEILKGALATLETDTALKAETRETLIRRVKLALRDMESAVQDRKSGLGADTGRLGQTDRQRDEERRRQEAEQIRSSQAAIKASREAGRYDEARKAYEDLARRFPGNPAIQAGSTSSGISGRIAETNDMKRQQADGRIEIWRGEQRSMRIPLDDLEFPANWRDRIAKRTVNRITEREKAIIKALNTVIPTEFEMTTFQQVIDYLEKKTGMVIILDKQALAEANVTYDSPITFKAKTTLRTVLKRILGDLNLAYIVKDEAIQVTSIQKAKETLSARTYYVGDLAGVGDMRFGPGIARLQMAAQIQQLAVLITQTIEPESWLINDKGGLGTIAFDPISMSFVVRQTAEIHYQMGFGFR